MEITEQVMGYVTAATKRESRKWPRVDHDTVQDLQQEAYIKIMAYDKTPKNLENYINYVVWSSFQDYVRKEDNRRRIENENADAIIKNTTPTLSQQWSGGPEEQAITVETLRERWRSLSPLLQRVAKRSFFGYEESPEKVASDLGMSVAAVNMARTRIKKALTGAE